MPATSISATNAQGGPVASQRLRIAYLLAAVGGYLDAYTYFERGGVFANAQTGNIVKLGIALANGARYSYRSYLIPIAAFAAGLVTSLAIKRVLEKRGIRFVRRSVLVVEVLGLIIVGFIPLESEWDIVANSIVSFVAAMQYETFTTFRGDVVVTTMSTGNLRKMVDSLFAGLIDGNRTELVRSIRYLSIICIFAFGAYLGTLVCGVFGSWAVLPAILMLVVAILTITALRRQRGLR